jgi:hypothetical protein
VIPLKPSANDMIAPFGDSGESDDLQPDRLLSGFELEALVKTLKRQQDNAVRQLENGVDGAKVYEICERWAVSHVCNDSATRMVDDAFALEIALREPQVTMILVTRTHEIGPEQLQRLCRRAPRAKMIFIDVSK